MQSIAMMLNCLHERMRKASGQEECNVVDCIESFFQWHTCVLTEQRWLVDSRPCPTSDNIFDEYVCHGQVRCPAESHWTLAADDSTVDSTIDGPHTDGNGIRGVDVHEYHLMTRCLVLTPRNGKCKRRRWKVEEDQQFSQDDQRPAKI